MCPGTGELVGQQKYGYEFHQWEPCGKNRLTGYVKEYDLDQINTDKHSIYYTFKQNYFFGDVGPNSLLIIRNSMHHEMKQSSPSNFKH